MSKFSKMKVHWWTYNHCLFASYLTEPHSDTDGYRILNFRNFRIRIGYGYSKNSLDMNQELKNQYPLISVPNRE